MIQSQTILKVIDNSGAKTVKCIKVLTGFQKRYAKLGDIIIISIQNLRNKSKKTSKVLKGDIYPALVVKTKNLLKKKDGWIIKCKNNAVVLLNSNGLPLGTRILSPLPKFLKKKKFSKFISISKGLF